MRSVRTVFATIMLICLLVGANQDFGRDEITGDPQDRYKFRTSPLRNVALQPTFMHNVAFTSLEDAVRHHLDVVASALHYTPAGQPLAPDLSGPTGPIEPVLARVDPVLATPILLSREQFDQLVAFLRNGLLDPRAKPEHLRRLVPRTVPSGRPVLVFEFPVVSSVADFIGWNNHDGGAVAAGPSAHDVRPRLFLPWIGR